MDFSFIGRRDLVLALVFDLIIMSIFCSVVDFKE